ncbi:MAG: NADH-quinone oxidoreductase subunit L [Elusimicrobiota bacterium]
MNQIENLLQLKFSADILADFMATVSTGVGMLIALYSTGYMKKQKHLLEFYFYLFLFIGAMVGLVYSANLILMYIFWEITAVCSWRLIGHYREEEHLLRADKAFIVTFFGSVIMLVGFGIIYRDFGTFNLAELKGQAVSTGALGLILCGILAKSAQLPLHIWLPDAGVAPTPVTALLHAAVLVKIGVYAFARLFVVTFNLPDLSREVIGFLSVASILVAGAAALVENDIKRILAYSTISQIGYVLLGLVMNGTIGIAGALFFILAHAFGKAGLFLCAGVVEHNMHTKDIRKLGGLIRSMPVTAVSFFVCALSIIGVPPMAGFLAKLFVIKSCFVNNEITLGVLGITGAVLTMFYLIRFFNEVFLGEPKTSVLVHEGSFVMVLVVLVLAILSVAAGLFPGGLIDLLGGVR